MVMQMNTPRTRWIAQHEKSRKDKQNNCIYLFTGRTPWHSWANMIERFFRDLTQNQLRRGIFRDVEELITAIGDYIDRQNEIPKPFV